MHDLSQRRAEFEYRSKLCLSDSLSLLEWNGKKMAQKWKKDYNGRGDNGTVGNVRGDEKIRDEGRKRVEWQRRNSVSNIHFSCLRQ